MKLCIIDGQGGRMGKMLVELLREALPQQELIAIGTNTLATSAMLKAGANYGATGENPVVYNCADADIIAGPIGIISANSLLGEITPAMANAVSASRAHKVLIPVTRCNLSVAGVEEMSMNDYVRRAVALIVQFVTK